MVLSWLLKLWLQAEGQGRQPHASVLGSSGVRAELGGAVGTCLYVLLLFVDAIRLHLDARLQDALIFSSPMNDRRQDDEDD